MWLLLSIMYRSTIYSRSKHRSFKNEKLYDFSTLQPAARGSFDFLMFILFSVAESEEFEKK